MKKIALVIVLIAVAAAGFYFFANRSKTPTDITPEPSAIQSDGFRPDPSNATFTFDDGAATLSGGRNERPVAPGSAFTEETVILADHTAYGDVNGDGKGDTIILLARYGAGSGTFIYAAAYVSGPVGYRGTNAVFIGDRIAPQNVSIASNGTITINYLDRAEDEPMASEPTIRTTKTLAFQNNQLVER